jgi:hypothetical protein
VCSHYRLFIIFVSRDFRVLAARLRHKLREIVLVCF